jgi:hypothetical protein
MNQHHHVINYLTEKNLVLREQMALGKSGS